MVRSDQNAAPLSLRAATPAWRLRKKLPWTNGYRVASAEVQRAMGESAALRGILLKFTQVFTSQSTQSAACNARHRTEQRLARWLLLAHDRMADATGCRLPTNISHSCSVSAPGGRECRARAAPHWSQCDSRRSVARALYGRSP